jgi:hypothetical protein
MPTTMVLSLLFLESGTRGERNLRKIEIGLPALHAVLAQIAKDAWRRDKTDGICVMLKRSRLP